MSPPNEPTQRTGTLSVLLAFGLAGMLACVRYTVHRFGADRDTQARSGGQSLAAVDLPPVDPASLGTGECRILLDPKALAHLSESARRNGMYQATLFAENRTLMVSDPRKAKP